MKIYPSTRYHADGRSIVVRSAEEDAALEGWAETPAAFTEDDIKKATPVPAHIHNKTLDLLAAVKKDYESFFEKIKACQNIGDVKKVLSSFEV